MRLASMPQLAMLHLGHVLELRLDLLARLHSLRVRNPVHLLPADTMAWQQARHFNCPGGSCRCCYQVDCTCMKRSRLHS